MADVPPDRNVRGDALALAKRSFLAGERVDMGRICQELGVSRMTLHRWLGSRDALLVEVVWPMAEATLVQEWAKVESSTRARVPRLIGGHLRSWMSNAGARRLLLEDNGRAMKIFTLASYDYQPRMINAIASYLALDVESGRTTTPLPVDALAFATVRIAESFAYLPTITGQDPDPDGAEQVLEAFLDRPVNRELRNCSAHDDAPLRATGGQGN